MSGLITDSHYSQQQRVILLLEYFGPSYAGMQVQPNAYTVQQALDDSLSRLNIPHGPLLFSGRTDAGVHAKGQVIQFNTPLEALAQIPHLPSALNATLPPDISVKDMAITQDMDFHVTKYAELRWYQYRVFNQAQRSVWMRPDASWFKLPLDVEKMHCTAQYLVGEHDFESFKCPQTHVNYHLCRVIHSQVYRDGPDVVFDIVANRFLYKMVRNIMGTLLEIGASPERRPEEIPEILSQNDRQSAGKTAKPEGLSLMAVYYPKPWDFFQNDVYVTRLNQVIQESSTHENFLRKAS